MFFYGITISLALTFLVLLIISLVQAGQHTSFIKKRISQIQSRTEKLAPQETVLSPLTDIASKKLEAIINKFVPQNIIKGIEKKILTAKLDNMDVAKYFLTKIIVDLFVLIFIPIYFAILKMKLNFGVLAMLLIIGFVFPDLFIKSKIEKRYKTIAQELPNFIDLLRVCIEAGMDMEGALNKIVVNSKGLLQQETAQTVTEIKMGKSIGEALQDMAARINYADFSAFVTMVVQSNQLGISISNVLKTQSQQINMKYLQVMRAKAAKIPVLILIPMVFFILPALLIVIIGPAIIQVINVF
jgi:tight adherence protein C